MSDEQALLYQQFDPARPLEANEHDLYVDWQKNLGLDNVKNRLAKSIALSGGVPVCRLFTGHRGVGKTTELKRVKRILETGQANRKVFVSLLHAERWIDLQDVSPADIVFNIVRQIVDDLSEAGFAFAGTRFKEFFNEFAELLKTEVELKDMKVGAGPVEFGVALKRVPGARATLRKLLERRLPNIYDLINEEILTNAKAWLKEKGFEDILIIVDELDRIPQKVIKDQGLTNHENLFVDHAGVLRFLKCDALYTIPIELAYSQCRERLKFAYGEEILSMPMIPTSNRDGTPCRAGLDAMIQIIQGRAKKANVPFDSVFESMRLAEHLCLMSGGHVRNLFILIRSCLDRCDRLPITEAIVRRNLRHQASDISLPLRPKHWDLLKKIHATKKPVEDDLWYGLLRDLFVFSYEDDQGLWYDWNPLLGELP